MRRTALSIALVLAGCSEPGMQAKRVSEDLAVQDVAAPPGLATSIAAFVTFVVAALPWALLLALLVWIGRRRGWRLRWPWRRRDSDPPPA